MISVLHRFHNHNSLKFVYQTGRTVRGPLTSLRYVDNPHRKTYRAAVVVSKKVSKSAVVRNRIRRRIYEQIRLGQNQISRPYDLVVTVFHDKLATLPAGQLEQLVSSQLAQAGVLTPKPVSRDKM